MNRERTAGDDSISPTQLLDINRACDRFEQAWRAGRRPAAEDHLGDAPGPVRSALLGELLATELECRLSLGERPAPMEYRERFPNDIATVDEAFARVGIGPGPGPAPAADATDAGRNLLFGLLALQNAFIGHEALLAAFTAWVADKSRALGGILLERGAIDAPRHALLEALVGEHLKQHGGDVERSLAALEVGGSTRESLKRVGDPDLDASVAQAGAAARASGDEYATVHVVSTSTESGVRFRVLRPHARGGLGAVFVALDAELNREVALKEILDHHADDPVSRGRFLLEAEITGGLEHPGIVPVYGLGTYADGRPYYAMRFIKGDSLKAAIAAFHADAGLKSDPGARSLALSKLLRRFLDVCNAIDYAHSRGVLHRDIKPGNVIVGRYGETLVIDWGLAKPTGRREPGSSGEERTLAPVASGGTAETRAGTLMGTPGYASPEQAAGDIARLGPRSDVYSLGATLYSLLTGGAPVSKSDASTALPSARSQGDIRPPRTLEPGIDRGLEAVCLKALANRPEDRYPTARALAEDVERWLADEPVTARQEPLAQRARRWARKHRTVMTGAAVGLVAGMIGLAVVSVVTVWANERLSKANVAISKANEKTKAALLDSEESRKQAEQVSKFLVEAFRSPDPDVEGRDVKVADVLDRAAERLQSELDGSQATKGALLDALGQTYHGLGLYDKAERMLVEARDVRQSVLGLEHPDTLASLNNLASVYGAAGRPLEAIKLHESTLKQRETTLGPDDPDTLRSRYNLAGAYREADRIDDAIKLYAETLRVREQKLGADHPDVLTSRFGLASAYLEAGRTGEAIKLQAETVRLMEARGAIDHSNTLNARNTLATAYLAAGRTEEAIALYESTLKRKEAKLGPDHPEALTARGNLAFGYITAGRLKDAFPLYTEVLGRMEAKLGPDHSNTLYCRLGLGNAYLKAGNPGEAIKLDEETRRLSEAKNGSDHRVTLASRHNLGSAYRIAGRIREAIAMHEGTLKLMEAKFGIDHPHTLQSRNALAAAYLGAGRTGEAIKLNAETFKQRQERLGADHRDTLISGNNLAESYRVGRRFGDSIKLHEEILKRREARLGPNHPDTIGSRNNLALALRDDGRIAAAIEIFETILAPARKTFGLRHRNTLNTTDSLALAYESVGRWSDAEPLRRELLARHRETEKLDSPLLSGELAVLAIDLMKQSKWAEAEPVLRERLASREKFMPDDWSRFNAMSMLGEALLRQAKFAEAEPLIVKGYEGMKVRAAKIPPPFRIQRLSEAADRVAALYEAWGNPEQAAAWKDKLGLADLPAEVFAVPVPGR